MQAIRRELFLQKDFLKGQPLESVYFGGGTPSLAKPADIRMILEQAEQLFQIATGAEITLETNPDDISREKLGEWKDAGINRLSIGVQSFFEEDLRWMNRAHNADQASRSLLWATAFFENITADLIYGVPGLADAKWKQNIETMLSYRIPHISCYALTVEPKTPLDKMIRQHRAEDVDPEQQARQFLQLIDRMEAAGYEHYEISSFALPGNRSRHNSAYWQGKPYLGVGPSAHSYDGNSRSWNIANNQAYITSINEGNLPFESEMLSQRQRDNEYIMTALRTSEGIDLARLSSVEKARLLNAAKVHLANGKLLEETGNLVLSKKGKLFADGIAADLFG